MTTLKQKIANKKAHDLVDKSAEALGDGTNQEELVEVEALEVGEKRDEVADPDAPAWDFELGVDYDAKVEVTVGDLLDMHRITGYCMRGNQRPAVLKLQQAIVKLLPKGCPIIHRDPV